MNKHQAKMAFLWLIVIGLLFPGTAIYTQAAGKQYRMNIEVSVDGMEVGYIAALDDSYENNLYISLKGLACALKETGKAFTPLIEEKKIDIRKGSDEDEDDSIWPSIWEKEALNETSTASPALYELYLDGDEKKYYSFIFPRGEEYDAFIRPISLAMMFDMDIKVAENRIEIDTSAPYSVSAREMELSGYLQGVNALVIGDGSTGEIFYQYKGDETFPVASTTKLMTYFVFMDAVSRGDCSLEDTAVITENAEKLSNSADGLIPMTAGSSVPVSELLYGMLLPSSNECALALAEYAAGNERAFVEQMNQKAKEFGWKNTEFYNCHGLPCFEDQLIPAKVQNHMTAEEMFELASVIMDTCPRITEFTSVRKCRLETLHTEVKNTNALLYNMENAVGLKTGTTDRAGACQVTCTEEVKDGKTHYLITVLFGAEGDLSRGTVSEMSARYAVETLQKMETGYQGDTGGKAIPADPEMVIKELLRTMK